MTFANSAILLLLLLLLPLLWWLIKSRRQSRAIAIYPDFRLLGTPRGSLRLLLARAWPWLRLPVLVLLIITLARPQTSAGIKESGGAGIDIMLTLDTSGSMRAGDFDPKDRFTVARDVLREFIQGAGANRLGLVVFSGEAFTQCPLAADHAIVTQLLEQVHIGMLEDGTAIGMAIATAANRLQASKAKSRVIILLTDGINNRGEIDPPTAAEAAAALGLKIYTIGVGRPGGGTVPMVDNMGMTRMVKDPGLDENMLKKIAKITGGQYFRATDAQALRQIYAQIDKMEKSEYTAKRERKFHERFGLYLWPALVLLMIQFLFGATWLRKAP